MEDNKTIFNYIGQVFTTFGIMMLIFVALTAVIGEAAKGYGSLFDLGSEGLSSGTILQLFLTALAITLYSALIFSDKIIKSMSIIKRNIAFYLGVTVVVALFVVIFKWFPVGDFFAWVGFAVSFTVCSTIGVFVSRMKEKAEDRKMNKALEQYNKR